MNQTLPYEDSWINCQLRERRRRPNQSRSTSSAHGDLDTKTADSYCCLPPACPFSGTYRQALTCPKSCPKNGDVPKSPFLQLAAIVAIGGHNFRILTLARTAVPSASECACANGPSLGHRPHQLIEEERRMQVLVRDNNVDQALRVLKKKMQREGLLPMKPRVIPGAPGRGGPARATRF